MPEPGHRIADRYEILGEMPRAGGAVLYRARDLAFGEVVALKQIARNAASLRALEADVRRVQRAMHPSFVRLHGIDAAEGILVREWVHGFSLLELIRRLRELPAPFALRLLEQLPIILDAVAERSLPLPLALLAKLLVRFDPATSPESVIAQPIAEWPPFSLKLNLVSVRTALPDADADNTAMTTLSDPRGSAGAATPSPTRLAQLLYELLGGPVRSGRDRRYTPLPALREEGNGVLRRALLESPYRDCRSLWADLTLAEPSTARPAAPLAAPVPPIDAPWILASTKPREPQLATVLKLTPGNAALPAIHLVARSKFKIGRSLFQADFVTRFLPESPGNDDLTNQLSRVHVLAEALGGRLAIRDGNGESHSVNGTTLDDELLDSEHAAPLRGRALLTLGGVYSLEVVPLLATGVAPLPIRDLEPSPAAHPRELGGAVFFSPANRQPILRHAIWMFSEIGFGIDAAQRIVWDTRGIGASPASFFYESGAFWLANRALDGRDLLVGGAALAPGEIAPLADAQELRIAAHPFTLELS